MSLNDFSGVLQSEYTGRLKKKYTALQDAHSCNTFYDGLFKC